MESKPTEIVNDKCLKLVELSDNEEVKSAIHKHPIGLVGVYATGLFIFAVIFIVSILLGLWIRDHQDLNSNIQYGAIISGVGMLISLGVLFFTYVSGFVYRNNVIVVTSEKIAEIQYKNLIDRKVSQFSLGDIQDVTVTQSGVLARIFNFGTISIETAGENNDCSFTYTPNPRQHADEVIKAHENSIHMYGN